VKVDESELFSMIEYDYTTLLYFPLLWSLYKI